MSNSILTSVKKGVGGIVEQDEWFDSDVIIAINTVFSKLTQLGFGPIEGFKIEDKTATWDQIITDSKYNMVESYVILSVKLLFDPPTASAVSNAITQQLTELEWRIHEQAELDKA